ncbi:MULTISPECIES: MAB_1171c family putative transporter [unclassified Streptomyces]|uniref:MAB_1171c family putative transporter n=2 Tax=Streptomyces TaxID=1883 RepID=UPI000381456A|nr:MULTISPECIES: MAB_1171c family putative transporter [unclassified Streptomyces]
MTGLINYVSCGALWLGLAVKTPDLIRHRHDPYLRAICAVLGLAGVCFLLGAAPTVGAVNRLSGVPNLAAPLTYASITAYSAASQVLIVHWRGGPRVRRVVRRWVVAYAVVLVGIAVMFALGSAPVERRTDLDTYYATTPFIAEMIVLYLLGHLTAVTVTTVSSLCWAREVSGRLRAGLVLLGTGSLCNAGYSVTKLVAVVARWCGRDWSGLGTTVSPAAAGLGALLTSVGILVPLAGPRLTQWRRSRRAYARLEPLERELDGVLTRHALRLPRPRWASPTTRLMWRQTSIHNALGYLDATFDDALYERVHAAALDAGGDKEHAEAAAWAAVIRAAVARAAAEGRDDRARPPLRAPDGLAPPGGAGTGRLTVPVPGAAVLVRVADALGRTPGAAHRGGTTAGAVLTGEVLADEVLTGGVLAGEVLSGDAVAAGPPAAGEVTAGRVPTAGAAVSEIPTPETMAAETSTPEAMAGEIPAPEVAAGDVWAGEIPTPESAVGEVAAARIPAAEVTAAEIRAARITAAEIPVGEMPAGDVRGGTSPTGAL